MVVVASAVQDIVIRSSLAPSDSRQRAISRAAARGDLVRVGRGAYVHASRWAAAGPQERHVLRVHAIGMRVRASAVVSHASAAAVLGWPRLGGYPDRIQITDPARSSARSSAEVRWHVVGLRDDEIVQIGRLRVTAPTRTLRDVLLASDRYNAVATADHALRQGLIARGGSRAVPGLLPELRGARRALDALAFADPGAESVGESFSRVLIDELGFAAPATQQVFRLRDGRTARTDFWWPEVGVVGEFDGRIKYTRGAAEEIAEVVHREKLREDDLRAHAEVRGVARWTWAALERPHLLAERLAAAGVPRRPAPGARRVRDTRTVP